MKYSHFETLALILGALAVVASVFMAPTATPQAAEVAAQLLLIVVLFGALHWGRNGGFLAALLAISLYVVMRLPLLQAEGLSGDMLTMLASRAVMYTLVGIVGGELASRIKYLFARMESDALVDSITGVYSPRFAAESIMSGVGQWERYSTDFSLVRIVLEPTLYAAFKPARYRQVMRQVTGHVRNDIRMVDDLAFAAPATLIVLLPRTPGAGASVVADRLLTGVSDLLGTHREALVVSVLSANTDADALRKLAESLHPAPANLEGQVPDRRRAADLEDRRGATVHSEAGGSVVAFAEEPQEPIS